jgi:hypothetical protein
MKGIRIRQNTADFVVAQFIPLSAGLLLNPLQKKKSDCSDFFL